MTKVIVNADDFGKSPERNRAIDDSFKQGLISSSGLIVTGKYLQDAVKLIKAGGYYDRIHLHVNLSANLLHEGSEDAPLTEAMQKDPFFCSEDGIFLPYKGLLIKLSSVRKWRIVYRELVAQYNKFIDVTEGKGDSSHIDFHLWYNLSWPVSVALNLFTRKYKIKSVRYIGLHQISNKKFRLFRAISWNLRVKYVPATNIDFFLSKNQSLTRYEVIELYCHPNYKDGIFLDDSPSYLKHERQPMLNQVQKLKEIENLQFIAWSDMS